MHINMKFLLITISVRLFRKFTFVLEIRKIPDAFKKKTSAGHIKDA